MIRPGVWFSVVAVALASATVAIVVTTSIEGRTVVIQLAVLTMILYSWFLLIGSARWIGIASVPLLIAAGIEAGFGEDPTWIRSVIIGCLWFVSVEAGWEAIDRRRGARYTSTANFRRIQDVLTVLGLAVTIGLIATIAATLAPARSVLLQAAVIGGLLLAFLAMVRSLVSGQSTDETAQS